MVTAKDSNLQHHMNINERVNIMKRTQKKKRPTQTPCTKGDEEKQDKTSQLKTYLGLNNRRKANAIVKKLLKHSNNNTTRAKVLIDRYIRHVKINYPTKSEQRIIFDSVEDDEFFNNNQTKYNKPGGGIKQTEKRGTIPGSIIYMRTNYRRPRLD